MAFSVSVQVHRTITVLLFYCGVKLAVLNSTGIDNQHCDISSCSSLPLSESNKKKRNQSAVVTDASLVKENNVRLEELSIQAAENLHHCKNHTASLSRLHFNHNF